MQDQPLIAILHRMADAPHLKYGVIRHKPRRLVPLLLVVAGVLGAIVVWPWACERAFEDRVGHNVAPSASPVRGLPDGASNVSYCWPGAFGPVTMFEFDITEAGFLAWAEASGWAVEPFADEPEPVNRYDGTRAAVINGYRYQWQHEDASRHVVYDRDHGRAYYVYHSR